MKKNIKPSNVQLKVLLKTYQPLLAILRRLSRKNDLL